MKKFRNCSNEAKLKSIEINKNEEEEDFIDKANEKILKEQFEIIKDSIEHLNKEEENKKIKKDQEINFLKEKRKKIENQKALLLEAMKQKQELEQKANEILIHEVFIFLIFFKQ